MIYSGEEEHFKILLLLHFLRLTRLTEMLLVLCAQSAFTLLGSQGNNKTWQFTNQDKNHQDKLVTWRKIAPAPNTDGLINCLLQPELLYLRIQKSMREIYIPLIKFCCTRIVPAAETNSIGLQANAQLSWFLHATLTTLSWHDKSCHLSGQRRQDNFILTPNARLSIGILQKHMPTRTRTATQLNRRAVRVNLWFPAR
jgi:hypothetical protein